MGGITTGSQHETRCLSCGRVLRSAKSIARMLGDHCAAKIRRAAEAEVLAGVSAEQAEKARQLIADKGIVPTARPGVYQAVSSDGTRTYLVTAWTCMCPAGKRARHDCYHQLAARILDIAATPPAILARPRTVIALPLAA